MFQLFPFLDVSVVPSRNALTILCVQGYKTHRNIRVFPLLALYSIDSVDSTEAREN